jgi:KaiC/GvpD/RAD55 family RecA-like ATPase
MATSAAIHSVHIYEDSEALLSRLCAIVSSSLRGGDSVLIVATSAHREQLLKDLQSCGLDVRTHAREGRYTMLDAQQTLATFMREGAPDNQLFMSAVGDVLDNAHNSALANGKRLTVFGEMVAVLWEQGEKEAALQLEALWNDALKDRAFHMHCAYPQSILTDGDLSAISSAHTHVVQ